MRRRVVATTRVASVNRRVVFVRGNNTAAEVLKTTSCSVTRTGVREGSALSQTPSVRDTTPLTTGGTPNPANLSSVLAGRMGFSTTAVAASRGVLNLVMPQCSTRALGPRMGHLPQLSGLLVGRERRERPPLSVEAPLSQEFIRPKWAQRVGPSDPTGPLGLIRSSLTRTYCAAGASDDPRDRRCQLWGVGRVARFDGVVEHDPVRCR
jgi:hypothetical protein